MAEVIDRLVLAMNSHDLDGVADLFHPDYRSEQPAHPDRAFVGQAQMRANWEAMFAGIPDFRAELIGTVVDGDTTWTEWAWSGTRVDGKPFRVRGVTLFEIVGEKVISGRLYMQDVDHEAGGIAQAVEGLSGRRPRQPSP